MISNKKKPFLKSTAPLMWKIYCSKIELTRYFMLSARESVSLYVWASDQHCAVVECLCDCNVCNFISATSISLNRAIV